jgi:hypothetical protein
MRDQPTLHAQVPNGVFELCLGGIEVCFGGCDIRLNAANIPLHAGNVATDLAHFLISLGNVSFRRARLSLQCGRFLFQLLLRHAELGSQRLVIRLGFRESLGKFGNLGGSCLLVSFQFGCSIARIVLEKSGTKHKYRE